MFTNRTPVGKPHEAIEGMENVEKLIDIDQSPDRTDAALKPRDLHGRLGFDARVVFANARSPNARLRAGAFFV